MERRAVIWRLSFFGLLLLPVLIGASDTSLANPELLGCYSHEGPDAAAAAAVIESRGVFSIRLADGQVFGLDPAEPGELRQLEEEMGTIGVAATLLFGLKFDELIIARASGNLIDPRQPDRPSTPFVIVNPEEGVFLFYRVPCGG